VAGIRASTPRLAELHIELLGGLRVRTEAGREIHIVSRKAQALLGCLALEPGVAHSRDVLAGLLWEDSDPELARASLRQALASLRRCLPGACAAALHGDGRTVALDAAMATSDVAQFRTLLSDGSPGALTRAVEQHAGILLDGLEARSPAFEQWLRERRAELRRLLLNAAERVAAQCAAVGDDAGAIAALERLVAIEASNERAQRDLMQALARRGRYTEALHQYRICREALRRDLDVAPEAATESLRRELMHRRRAAPATSLPDAQREPDIPRAASPAPTLRAEAVSTPAEPGAESMLREAVILVARLGETPADVADDPESARNWLAATQSRIAAVVERHGGRADGATAGEVLAAFGLSAVAGNEVEHAVRAALELVACDGAGIGRGPALAVGVAQGQVLPASQTRPFPLSGRPALAARELARAAGTGEVAVALEVVAQISDRYALAAMGGGAPAGAQRLLAASATEIRPPGRFFTGRRAELAMLLTLLERVEASRRGRAVILRGEPGIGKSSLIEALAAAARGREAAVHVVQVLDFGQAANERPLPALAACLLAVAPEAGDAARVAAVARAIASGRLAAADELAARDLAGVAPPDPAVSPLSAMDDAARERSRTRVLLQLLRTASESAPLLVIVEDIHWADAVEAAQLADLAAACATLPVLLALSTRLDGDPTAAGWRARARGCPVTTVDLAPLADDEARELAARYAGLPSPVIEECLEKAAGHPLFLDQLLRTAQTGQRALPGSVRGLLLARIGRLPPALQRGLRAAAVLGARFSRDALRHVLAEPHYDLGELQQAGLVAADGDDCRFMHALIRDAVYESLLRSTRRELHRRSAAWFEARDAGLEADHLAAADDPAAPTAYLRAAAEEQRASRLERALAHAQRSRDLARAAPDLCAAFARIGDICLARGRTDDAIAAFRESVDLASSGGERARGWLGLAASLRIVDRYDEALAALTHAEQAAGAQSDPRLLAQLWTLRGNVHFPRGELDQCLDAHSRALEHATRAGSAEDIARAFGGLGDAQYQRGRMRTAHAEFGRCVAFCEQHGFAALRLTYLPMLSVTEAYLGNFAAALDIVAQSERAASQAGDLRTELLSNSIRASIELYRANEAEALAASQRSVRLAREIGARRFEAEALIVYGLAALRLRDDTLARQSLAEGVALARETARTYCGPWALASLALATDDADDCRALLDEGERWLADGCVSHNYFEYYRYAIEVGVRSGDWARVRRAADALDAYTRDEGLPWSDLVIRTARALDEASRATAGADAVAQLDAALGAARQMQFNQMAVLLEQGRRP
jgi:DNA-binding SARP family transcriptional activator